MQERDPIILRDQPAVGTLGIMLRPSFTKRRRDNLPQQPIVVPKTLIARRIPTPLRQHIFVLDEAPRPNDVAAVLRGPIVKEDLAKDFSTILVDKVVQFDQIDPLSDNTDSNSGISRNGTSP